ncbi:hypothetical protein BS47DRAFT_1353957 [Hydnum rufescens UP504]|uniref:Uncharacterized protein n=1 Tax=Hydnum rufescens UP504 TaxID=1448309 RepID=A0A9P6DKY6_9AGAM|nr:hypothetical protein BS47DRAFT_1353957 [Hydnum rufescens UP504]
MVLSEVLNWGPPFSNTPEIYIAWNTSLAEYLEEFKPAFPLAKVFPFSLYHTFARLSDHPSLCGMVWRRYCR